MTRTYKLRRAGGGGRGAAIGTIKNFSEGRGLKVHPDIGTPTFYGESECEVITLKSLN